MISYMAYLAIVGLVGIIIMIAYSFINRGLGNALKGLLTGTILALIDLVIEYFGTSTMRWTYTKSVYMIVDLVPIELLVMFFALGVITRFFYDSMKVYNAKIPYIRTEYMLLVIILGAAIFYLQQMYMTSGPIRLLAVTIPFALWGLLVIKPEHRSAVLALAITVGILDIIVETFLLSYGEYTYATGFIWSIPYTYALLTLGLFGLVEKMDKLDSLLKNRVVKFYLRRLGITQFTYTVEDERRKMQHKIRNLSKNLRGSSKLF